MLSKPREVSCGPGPGQADLVPLNCAAASLNHTQEHGRGRAPHLAARLLSTMSTRFPPWPSQDKAGAHSSFSHQAFITKKIPELPSHPLQPSPHGLGASPSAGWVCCGQGRAGSRLSHGGWLLTGTEWVIFFFFRALGLGGVVSARSACPLEQSFPVL